jgi:hypothetical protein
MLRKAIMSLVVATAIAVPCTIPQKAQAFGDYHPHFPVRYKLYYHAYWFDVMDVPYWAYYRSYDSEWQARRVARYLQRVYGYEVAVRTW